MITYLSPVSSNGSVSLSWSTIIGLEEPLLEVVLDIDGGLTSIRYRLGSWRKLIWLEFSVASNASGLMIPHVIMCVIVHSSQGHLKCNQMTLSNVLSHYPTSKFQKISFGHQVDCTCHGHWQFIPPPHLLHHESFFFCTEKETQNWITDNFQSDSILILAI